MTRSLGRRGAACALLLCLALLSGCAASASRSTTHADLPDVPAAEAGRHVGRLARVCGHVASAAHFPSTAGSPTFLNLDRAFPNQVFTVVIWGGSRARFATPPERLFDGKSVCVTGTIGTHRGTPQIVVGDPSQIVLASPVPGACGAPALTDLERTLVKAVLAFLGHEANYGSAQWDQAATEAAIEFQEANGLAPTGEPDAATLRAVAGRVGEMTERDRTMVIQLLLLELARRQG